MSHIYYTNHGKLRVIKSHLRYCKTSIQRKTDKVIWSSSFSTKILRSHLLKESNSAFTVQVSGLFNNYVTHRAWVGLSVFRDVA